MDPNMNILANKQNKDPMNVEKIRVVIADDHPIVTAGVNALLLKEPGKELIGSAPSGKELFKLLAQKRADVLLLDLNIPGEDFSKTIKKLKENHPFLRIVAYTSYNHPDLIKSVVDLKVDGFLLKNSTKQDFLKAIEMVRAGEFFMSREVRLTTPQENPTDTVLMDGFQKRLCLSKREQEILRFISRGFTSQGIGKELFISRYTVETHRKNILRKLNFNSSTELVKFAVEQGLV
jgi:two-component system nitrate/nitrite response regulator NarL